jgi:N-glycosylase/DNA lyase
MTPLVNLPAPDFNLEATLESGQVFGFSKNTSGAYQGMIRGCPVTLRQEGRRLLVGSSMGPKTVKIIRRYFDLGRDLKPVYKILKGENFLGENFARLQGLRLIQQDAWEALACFILSSNNNVKRIQGIWKNLERCLSSPDGGFPSPAQIARSHERILRGLGLGYRAPFLLHTAQFVSANPQCLEVIRQSSYEEAKARVLSFPGIGEKVADCVLLYGFQKYEAFPVDVWILRAMRKLYFKNRKVSEEKVRRFGQKRWSLEAGYVQQYLFHGARLGMIE